MMEDGPGPSSRPPAAKKVVAALPRVTVAAQTQEQLGGPDAACPVCTEHLQPGEEVQLLPCKHVFHPPCLAPWLAGALAPGGWVGGGC
jgi:E3 ubiquitin-protein ligase AIP2